MATRRSPPPPGERSPPGTVARARGPDPDAGDLRGFREGDPAAFDRLVLRHQDRVHRLATRMLGDREAALDAAQETFVKAWKALPRFEGAARFSTWLTRIAINQCRNELRRRRTVKHQQPLSLDVSLPGTDTSRAALVEDPGPDVTAYLREDEVRAACLEALSALEPEAREVMVLKDVETLSYEDIAEILDVPVGTVRSRLHRARAEVRRRMEGVLAPEGEPEEGPAVKSSGADLPGSVEARGPVDA